MSVRDRQPNTKHPDLWVVLDLGGVLFNFDGIAALADLTGRSVEVVRQSLIASPSIEKFETGRITPERFAEALVDELDLPLSPADFLHRWTHWEAGEKPGAFALLDDLGARFNLACLSNTSVVHWARLHELRGIGDRFHRHYASHLIGHWKPNPQIFAHVAADLGPGVARIIYFDDNAHIVEAARDHGWDAHEATSPGDVEAGLRGLGLFS